MNSTLAASVDPARPTDLAQLRGELTALLPPSISSAVIAMADHSERLFPSERSLIEQASQLRVESFSSGRLAARMALGQAMGHDAEVAIAADQGAPVPPAGWRLSITHDDRFAAAAACRAEHARGLGIDLERVARMDAAWRLHVVGAHDRIADSAGALELTVVFSLKESLFKALPGAGAAHLADAVGVHWTALAEDAQLVWAAEAPSDRPDLRWRARAAREHVLTYCLAV